MSEVGEIVCAPDSERLVIACEMMEGEILRAAEEAGLACPIEWVERNLHNSPDRLRVELQRRIDRAPEGCDVLLAFAQCGNAVSGLRAARGRLVVPRFADCIHLLLSPRKGSPGEVDMRTLYTSKGYLDGDGGIRGDYRHAAARYGEERARRICRKLVAGYGTLRLMNSGGDDPDECAPAARELARLLGLAYGTCPATIRVYGKLFSGDWDEEFLVIQKGGTITEGDFRPKDNLQRLIFS